MFYGLLASSLALAFVMSFILANIFKKPMEKILNKVIQDEISSAWLKYMVFAIYVTGVSSGARLWQIDRYVPRLEQDPDATPIVVTAQHWAMEITRTIIGSLQGVAWMLLVFFIFTMIVYVVVRLVEGKRAA